MSKLIKKYAAGDTVLRALQTIQNYTAGDTQLFKGMDGIGKGIAMVADLGSSLIPHKLQAALTEGLNTGFDVASTAMMAIPGFGTIAGAAMKGIGLLSDGLTALGVGTDGVTTMDQILDSKWLKLTPTGLVNALGALKLASLASGYEVDEAKAMSGGAYGGVMDTWDDASKYAGKKVGLFSNKSSLNNKIYNANAIMRQLLGIMGKKKELDLLTASMEDRWNQSTENMLNGGFGNISFGRLGLKVEILPKVHAILNKPKTYLLDPIEEEEIPEFKLGGKMNVIPEGSLHARLHHMENAEGLTRKGIPVVAELDGGLLEQQAEIELNEIIFNLDVTEELEKLMKDGTDNAAIEAGKLLVEEIFNNTDDRTGLIKLLKPKQKEQTTEDIVKNHQVFQKGGSINKPNKTIEELVDYAIQLNPAFVQRIGPDMGYAEFDLDGKRYKGTHLLGYTTHNNKYMVFPLIQMKEGRLLYILDLKEAFDTALRNNNVLAFDNLEDAELFSSKYKESRLWKLFFDRWSQRFGSYKYGGIIEKLDTLSEEELLELRKYLKLEEA